MKSRYKTIHILGAHKSGTSLLRSLLDGHPDLQVIPIETHYLAHLGYEIKYPLRKQKRSIRTLKEVKHYARLNILNYNETPSAGMADAQLFQAFNMTIYDDVMKKCNEVDEFIDYYFEAIYKSFYNKPLDPKKFVVEKSVEHVEFKYEIQKIFSENLFLHILRNPYSNITSLRKYYVANQGHYPKLKKLAESIKPSFRYSSAKDSLLVHYEDLTIDSKAVLNKICSYLQIEYDPILTKPTVNKINWKGNSSSQIQFHEISSKQLNKWEESIYDLEIRFVNKYFDYMGEYKKVKPMNNFRIIKVIKSEYIFTYFKNRMDLFLK